MGNILFDRLFEPHRGAEKTFLRRRDGREVSYGAFLDTAARYANALQAMDVEPGDRVAVHVQKSIEALALYAASLQAGAVFLPLNPAYTAHELDYFIEDSGASILVTSPENSAKLETSAERSSCRLETMDASGAGSWADRSEGFGTAFPTVDRDWNDLAAILYTSGTTGRSKGAMLTHGNLLSNAEVLAEVWRFSPDDVLIHALPVFHTHGLFVATNVTVLTGASMIFLERFDVDDVLSALPVATTMMGVPTFYTRLLDDPRFKSEVASHMRLFISGSAPLLAETHERFRERTGHAILERYGMTETSMNTSHPYDGPRKPGSVGLPLPGVEIRVLDTATGQDVAPGEVGMIHVRGPNVFKGYWRNPEKTREDLRADGFFVTGDLGLIDEDGHLQIVGRGKDLIISGGYNIYPKEIEAFLDQLPGVQESAVIAAPHRDLGESVVAVLVPANGARIDIDAVDMQAREAIAGFKRPRHYAVVDSLPRNTMGKVQKNALRERYSHVFDAP